MTALMLDAALDLARAGLPVFGLLPGEKRPRFLGGFRNATTDLAVITAHWRRHRRDNVGVRPPEGVLVLDIDPRSGGDRSLAQLLKEYGPLPETWTVRTGSGGKHYWFTVGDIPLRSTLAKGIDLKSGSNGFVVAPPSVHPNGGHYLWEVWPSRRHRHPAVAPEWLTRAVQPAVGNSHTSRWAYTASGMNGHGQYTVQCLCARIAAAREGRRHTTFYGAVRDAQRQGDLDAYEGDLASAALAVGLDANEIASTLRSVRRGG